MKSLRLLFVSLPLLATACADFFDSNPLLGRWTAEAPMGAFSLGSYEFGPHSMTAFGTEQDVDYAVSGDTVRVMPRGFGPQLEVTLVDQNTARVGTPLTGQLVTLRRVR